MVSLVITEVEVAVFPFLDGIFLIDAERARFTLL